MGRNELWQQKFYHFIPRTVLSVNRVLKGSLRPQRCVANTSQVSIAIE